MKIKSALLVLPCLCGCLSSAPKAPVNWTIETEDLPALSGVRVFEPYDGTRLAVLRANGSIAFDAYNVFAAKPSALIKNAVSDPRGPQLTVRRLALDCREGKREALVSVDIVKDGKKKSGIGRVAADDGDYSAAFTKALNAAVASAVK